MPPRIARSSVQSSSQPSKKPRTNQRNPKKSAKRALNAFSIAQYENPEKVKINRNRLGEIDPSFSQRKRPRDEEEEDDDEEDEGESKRRKRRGGDEEFDEGSDSDGNTWTMGHIDVDDDDDEDIDSDEAFGESDEERFEDFTFRGSSTNKKGNKSNKARKEQDMDDDDDFDMDESDSADGEEDEDDLGEDAIDLATALDQYEEDEAEERREREKKKKKVSGFGDDDSDESPSEGDDVAADGASDLESSSDEEADEEDERQAKLKALISGLAKDGEDKGKSRKVEVHESAVPDEFGVARKVDLFSFKPKVADEEKKRSLKLLQDDKSSKRADIARRLDAPLPKRQQDKLDRAAANAKANETLERWTDTIKRNRRAENLTFPLQNKTGGDAVGETRLQPTTTSAPANDLESTIQAILQQSGLSNGAEDEDKIRKGEELELNKRPIEEVMKNRAQLRLARELAFREEIRAKRIKKIKSKAYRRVHRKEREKLLEKERAQLKADGVDLSEEEREYNDRRRAEERMGAKHRESKWAKGIKATGRAAWDQDALDGVTEMARRNEELRRRIEGKAVRNDDEDASDVPSDADDSEDDSDVDNADDAALQRSLSKLKHNPFSADQSKLGQMAFMQRAEAAKRAQNDEDIERIRRELAGEDSVSEEEAENATKVGRKKYGPAKEISLPLKVSRNEFEEQPDSDDEDAPRAVNGEGDEPTSNDARSSTKSSGPLANGLESARKSQRKDRDTASKAAKADAEAANPFLTKAKKDKKTTDSAAPQPKGAKAKSKSNSHAAPQETTIDSFLQQRVTAADEDGWATILGGQDDSDADSQADDLENDGIDLDLVLRNQALTAKGFAGDNVAADFSAEKAATIADEESSTTTTHLPGWGSWTGSGTKSKGAKTVTKKAGLDANKRKDKNLSRVIINEKRAKPTVKYMASQLPFPFESREQYERSLALPKGKEWTTKRTFQDATRPRVVVKQGVVAPLRKPLV